MASVFELQDPNFGRLTKTRTVVAGDDAATTLTAAQCIESIITVTPTTGRAYTTATGAAILSELGINNKVGQSFEVTIVNLAASTHAITFTAGATGVTITGLATVAANTSATFVGRVASSSAVVFYRK